MYRRHPLNPEFGRSRRMGFHLTGGMFFPLVGGGHLLYRSGANDDAIDYNLPVGVAGPTDAEVTEMTYMPHEPNATYRYGLRAIAPCGCEEQNTDVVTSITFDADGNLAKFQANSPWGLQVKVVSKTATQVIWKYDAANEKASPRKFNLYCDDVLVGQAGYTKGLKTFSATASHSESLTHRFRVRSVTAEGIEDENTVEVVAFYDQVAPPSPRSVIVEKIGGGL
jgi:hypothetical protein